MQDVLAVILATVRYLYATSKPIFDALLSTTLSMFSENVTISV